MAEAAGFDWLGAGSAIGGGLLDWWASNKKAALERENWEKNATLQREFAQNGIQWKVEDARKAGVHPLYALGAVTAPATPMSIGETSSSEGMYKMGQSVLRAIHATRNTTEKQLAELQVQREKTQLEGDVLENQVKASQLRLMRQNENPPIPAESTWLRSSDGNLVQYPSPEASQAMQGAFLEGLMYSARKRLGGIFYPPDLPKGVPLDVEHQWTWEPISQQYVPSVGSGLPGEGSEWNSGKRRR